MTVFDVPIGQNSAMAEFICEQHAQSELALRKIDEGKCPVHDVVSVRRSDTPQHDTRAKVATALLPLAKYCGSIQGQAGSFFAKPVAEVTFNIRKAVERRVWAGETSVDAITSAMFDKPRRLSANGGGTLTFQNSEVTWTSGYSRSSEQPPRHRV